MYFQFTGIFLSDNFKTPNESQTVFLHNIRTILKDFPADYEEYL